MFFGRVWCAELICCMNIRLKKEIIWSKIEITTYMTNRGNRLIDMLVYMT